MANGNGYGKLSLPDLSVRQLATATVIIVGVALSFWLLFRFYQVVLILLAGIIVSLALRPIVERLRARGVPAGVAVGAIYSLLFIIGVLFLRYGAPIIAEQAATISSQLSEGYTTLRENLVSAPNLLIRRMAESLPEQVGLAVTTPPPAEAPPPDAILPEEAEAAPTGFEQVGRYLGLTAQAIYQIAAIFLIAFFWTIESERIKRSAVALLPLQQRDGARGFIGEVEERVGAYVLGQLTLSGIMGVLSFIAYLIIGLPFALVLAVLVAVMELVPLIGPLIGILPAIVVALSESPLTALWTVIASLIIHQLEANVFGPRVMKKTLGMRPLVTLLALTAFGSLFGILGAIIALPLTAVLQLVFDRIVQDSATQADTGERDRISVLRYETQHLVEDMRRMLRRRDSEQMDTANKSETVEDTLEAIALDLDSLLAQYRGEEAA